MSCVQCQKQLDFRNENVYENVTGMEAGFVTLNFCNNPKCPNYGVVALPIEFLPSEEVENESK